MKIKQIIDLLIDETTGTPLDDTVDTLKCGSPDTEVTGIVTTFMATVDVIHRAIKCGANLIITHEPLFYNHWDQMEGVLENDQIIAEKKKLLEENQMAVFRFHDYWHERVPDGILTGMIEKLSWGDYQDGEDSPFFNLPEFSVGQLAASMKEKLGGQACRIVGDSQMRCHQVCLCVGFPGSDCQIENLQRGDVEVLIAGEAHEWETVEYVRDAQALGHKKALILLGHRNSEEAGMAWLEVRLNQLLPDSVPVCHLSAGDPLQPI